MARWSHLKFGPFTAILGYFIPLISRKVTSKALNEIRQNTQQSVVFLVANHIIFGTLKKNQNCILCGPFKFYENSSTNLGKETKSLSISKSLIVPSMPRQTSVLTVRTLPIKIFGSNHQKRKGNKKNNSKKNQISVFKLLKNSKFLIRK